MLKNILKLDGVKELSKNEQKNVKGGACNAEETCCHLCNCQGAHYIVYPGQCPSSCNESISCV